MDNNDFSNFEEAKENYLRQLEKMFEEYNITLPYYMYKIREKNISRVNNPSNEKELHAAIRCYEIVSGSLEYGKSKKLSGYDNMVITLYSFLIKGIDDRAYFKVAQDYMNKIMADPILFGNYIVDDYSVNLDDLDKDLGRIKAKFNVNKIAEQIKFRKLLVMAIATINQYKNNDSYLKIQASKTKGKKGTESYAELYDIVYGYLNEYYNQQNIPETFAMTYRRRNGL